jgi:hypothetical protein
LGIYRIREGVDDTLQKQKQKKPVLETFTKGGSPNTDSESDRAMAERIFDN